jgi:3-oxoacyl-[acyl-carrier protein] reductase
MLKQRSGVIVNIASIVGIMGNAGQANYSASKAGLIGFTKTVAKELASRGIHLQRGGAGIHPDRDDGGKLGEPEAKKMQTDFIALKRLGLPEDVANVVLFLASDLSRRT